jgi:phage regulator Rha-like protein
MNKIKLINLTINILFFIIVISFFTIIFIKNFTQLKNIFFISPQIESNEKEIDKLINDLDKNLENYFRK